MIIDGSMLSQGVAISVPDVTTRIVTHAEILTSPTTPVVIVPARPSVLVLPRWFVCVCMNNDAYTNVDGGASVVYDWSAGPIGGTGMTAAQAFTAITFNDTVARLNGAGFQSATVFSGAVGARLGAAVVLKTLNGALGNFTGGGTGNRWLVSIIYQSFQIPQGAVL